MIQLQQIRSQQLKRPQLGIRNVCSGVLGETKHEKPTITFVGRNQRANAATFTTPIDSHALFQYATAKIGVRQTLHHLAYSETQDPISKAYFAQPALKMACFEYSMYGQIIPLSGMNFHIHATNSPLQKL